MNEKIETETKKEGEKSRKKEEKEKIEKLLIENLIEIQKKFVEVTTQLKQLSQNLEKLMNIFESAYSEMKETKSIENTLNEILKQNKIIAKGILLLEKHLEEKEKSF